MNNIGNNAFDIGYMDTLASADTPLHRLDARAKLVTTLVFIVTIASFDRYAFSALLPFFIYPAVLIALGNIPPGYILKKLLVVSPFAVLVGMVNPFVDRGVLVYIGSTGISGGWISFFSIILRFILTAAAALILVSLTGFNAVCESLMRFGVPRALVVQLLFSNPYMFVLIDEVERISRAESLRSCKPGAVHLKVFVSLLGNLLLRTLDRAERIYTAMRCRGFDGTVHMMSRSKGGYREVLFVLGWSLLFVFFRYYNVSLRLGEFLTGGF